VIPAARSAIAEENGTIVRKFAYRDPVTNKVEHRRMIRQLDSGGSMWEYTVRDQCNSPICEQTFVHFGAFKKQCKSIRACVARLYLKSMRDAWNMDRTEAMERAGLNPTPAPTDILPAPPPPRFWQLALFGDSNQ
jgi:hypothetical protein